MATFQDTREQTEQKVMVHLLTEIERNPSFTQRGLAQDLGIALGLMNQYLKRCMTKGWIRASQLSPRRITYFLTPEGFREKSIMVKDYLSRSMSFFRDAKVQCQDVFNQCISYKWKKIALVGAGDLADIAQLVASGFDLDIHVVDKLDDLCDYHAVIITDIMTPQHTYDVIKEKVDYRRIILLDLLHISKGAS